ncbi:hypothetical protein [Isoalcanivorax beigongshangi]|uniref:DUF4142 domain-containing protein n=1 Tax=Isoalcanivorax beigongshangi TaxID=3238810 RepID=A0ABV4AFP5_9GAMM
MQKNKGMMKLGLALVMGSMMWAPVSSQAAFGGLTRGGQSESGTAVDVDTLVDEQKVLMGKLHSAMSEILQAQSLTLEAQGFREQAAATKAVAGNYASGNVSGADAVKRDIQMTRENQELIEKGVSESEALSSEGLKTLTSALPHYVEGTRQSGQLGEAFQAWTASSQSAVSGSLRSNPMKARKLKGALSEATAVLSSLPDLISAWSGTTRSFIGYGRSNNVDVSDVEARLGDL